MSKFAKKQKPKKITTFPDRAGKKGKVEYILGYNKTTRRYDLKANGVMRLSHVNHAACLRRAGHGINWKKIAKDSDG